MTRFVYAAVTVGAGILGGLANPVLSIAAGIMANDIIPIWDRVGRRLQGNEHLSS